MGTAALAIWAWVLTWVAVGAVCLWMGLHLFSSRPWRRRRLPPLPSSPPLVAEAGTNIQPGAWYVVLFLRPAVSDAATPTHYLQIRVPSLEVASEWRQRFCAQRCLVTFTFLLEDRPTEMEIISSRVRRAAL